MAAPPTHCFFPAGDWFSCLHQFSTIAFNVLYLVYITHSTALEPWVCTVCEVRSALITAVRLRYSRLMRFRIVAGCPNGPGRAAAASPDGPLCNNQNQELAPPATGNVLDVTHGTSMPLVNAQRSLSFPTYLFRSSQPTTDNAMDVVKQDGVFQVITPTPTLPAFEWGLCSSLDSSAPALKNAGGGPSHVW